MFTALMGIGLVYALGREFTPSPSLPSTGTISVSAYSVVRQPNGSYEGSYVQVPVTVTGPESHNGTTLTTENSSLNFAVVPGQYFVSGAYGNATPVMISANVQAGSHIKILLNFASPAPPNPQPSAQAVSNGLELNMTLDNATYYLGEPMNITLSFSNISNQTINFTYADPLFDFWIYNGTDNTVYQWSAYKAFSDLTWNIPLNAGGSFSQTYVWQQTSNETVFSDGVPVSPGTYYIVGQIGLTHWLQTTPIEVNIVGP